MRGDSILRLKCLMPGFVSEKMRLILLGAVDA